MQPVLGESTLWQNQLFALEQSWGFLRVPNLCPNMDINKIEAERARKFITSKTPLSTRIKRFKVLSFCLQFTFITFLPVWVSIIFFLPFWVLLRLVIFLGSVYRQRHILMKCTCWLKSLETVETFLQWTLLRGYNMQFQITSWHAKCSSKPMGIGRCNNYLKLQTGVSPTSPYTNTVIRLHLSRFAPTEVDLPTHVVM